MPEERIAEGIRRLARAGTRAVMRLGPSPNGLP